MGKARLSPRAQRQLNDIWLHIAQDNEAAADRLLTRIFDKMELSSDNPGIGAPRPDIHRDTRMLVVGAYLILYLHEAGGLVVAAVVHGMTDPDAWID